MSRRGLARIRLGTFAVFALHGRRRRYHYSRKRYTSDAIDCELFPTAAMVASSPIDMLAKPMTKCEFCRAAALSARALYRYPLLVQQRAASGRIELPVSKTHLSSQRSSKRELL